MSGGFDFNRTAEGHWHNAVRTLWTEYLVEVLGWTPQSASPVIEAEISGSNIAQMVSSLGWDLSSKVVVDVGCGTGVLLGALPKTVSCVVGMEPGVEFSRAARLRVKGREQTVVIRGSGSEIPLPNASADAVFCLQVLEHVPDPRPVISEIARILKPGGRAIINFPNYLSFHEHHYEVKWFPLLPKPIGSLYLRLLGRDPGFLQKHIFYTIGMRETFRCYNAGLIPTTALTAYEKVGRRLPRRLCLFLSELRRLFDSNYTLEVWKLQP